MIILDEEKGKAEESVNSFFKEAEKHLLEEKNNLLEKLKNHQENWLFNYKENIKDNKDEGYKVQKKKEFLEETKNAYDDYVKNLLGVFYGIREDAQKNFGKDNELLNIKLEELFNKYGRKEVNAKIYMDSENKSPETLKEIKKKLETNPISLESVLNEVEKDLEPSGTQPVKEESPAEAGESNKAEKEPDKNKKGFWYYAKRIGGVLALTGLLGLGAYGLLGTNACKTQKSAVVKELKQEKRIEVKKPPVFDKSKYTKKEEPIINLKPEVLWIESHRYVNWRFVQPEEINNYDEILKEKDGKKQYDLINASGDKAKVWFSLKDPKFSNECNKDINSFGSRKDGKQLVYFSFTPVINNDGIEGIVNNGWQVVTQNPATGHVVFSYPGEEVTIEITQEQLGKYKEKGILPDVNLGVGEVTYVENKTFPGMSGYYDVYSQASIKGLDFSKQKPKTKAEKAPEKKKEVAYKAPEKKATLEARLDVKPDMKPEVKEPEVKGGEEIKQPTITYTTPDKKEFEVPLYKPFEIKESEKHDEASYWKKKQFDELPSYEPPKVSQLTPNILHKEGNGYIGFSAGYSGEEAKQSTGNPNATDWKGSGPRIEMNTGVEGKIVTPSGIILSGAADVLYSEGRTNMKSNNPNITLDGEKERKDLEARVYAAIGKKFDLGDGNLSIYLAGKGVATEHEHSGSFTASNNYATIEKQLDDKTSSRSYGAGILVNYVLPSFDASLGYYHGTTSMDIGVKPKGDFKSFEASLRKSPVSVKYIYEKSDANFGSINYESELHRLAGELDIGKGCYTTLNLQKGNMATDYDKVSDWFVTLGLGYRF